MTSTRSRELIELEDSGALPTTIPFPSWWSGPRASGSMTWTGNRYLDCLSAYSAVNQGHATRGSSRR
jgi:acetylornithine/succinyldiaminopimelate/putrescine aminotransferase